MCMHVQEDSVREKKKVTIYFMGKQKILWFSLNSELFQKFVYIFPPFGEIWDVH